MPCTLAPSTTAHVTDATCVLARCGSSPSWKRKARRSAELVSTGAHASRRSGKAGPRVTPRWSTYVWGDGELTVVAPPSAACMRAWSTPLSPMPHGGCTKAASSSGGSVALVLRIGCAPVRTHMASTRGGAASHTVGVGWQPVAVTPASLAAVAHSVRAAPDGGSVARVAV